MAKKLKKYDDLNEKQQLFIEEYLARGGSRTAATEAVKAVYGYEDNAANAMAWRMLRNEHIRAALADRTTGQFSSMAAIANDRLMEILTHGTWFGQPVKPSEGLKAIKEAVERGIGPVVQKREIEITDNRTVEEVKVALADKLNALSDADKALIAKNLGVAAIDAEFVDVSAPYGRRKDGTPKNKDGRPEKTLLPGPDAYRPPTRMDPNLPAGVALAADIKRRKLRMEYERELAARKQEAEGE